MDLGIAGRRAYIAHPDDAVSRACAAVLAAEGVEMSATPVGCEIVVSHCPTTATHSVLDRGSLDELRSAWATVAESVEAYRAALTTMVERRWGRFVFIGSALAKSIDADDDEAGAIVSLGMMGLHKVITGEEAPHNVISNTVLRGGGATDEDIANAVAFLCSDGAGYLSGITMTVDAGVGSAVL